MYKVPTQALENRQKTAVFQNLVPEQIPIGPKKNF